ncbi:SufS family cysteine desulfurase [Marinobacterium sediminicola]|uniref:cysteine desulfurase n=1 Tax=Marinobacterium sediminicola TaxID=518898 RepID=A0ABY1RW44_9GAMM|nr:SufS family cysteine desulfurase [Marinobacterium sediminicola]ULG70440.1 SufS family cysteine desulfurase [Marinobacterium sediminicola]SMR69325.1 cysteine desulfurase [Marinobacterium sediminicola]
MSQNDPKRWRRDFPLLSMHVHGQPLVYLDNAATTQKPRPVIDAVNRFYKTANANVHRGSHALSMQATAAFELAREKVARWLGIDDSATLIWTRGTTEAINLVAQSWGRQHLQRGDLILLMQSAHHANIVPWQMLAAATGAHIEIIPLQADGDIDLNAYHRLLEQRPVLVALAHVSNALGTIYPVETLCREAKSAGATVLVDGAQALPHFDVSLEAMGCDFYAFSGHKVFGPTGIGALWGRRELLEAMPPWQGGGEMIEHVSFDSTRYAGLPFKFEAGTPDISGAIGLAAAIDYLGSQDRQAMEAYEQSLLKHALEGCRQIAGFRPVASGSQRVSLLSFELDGFHQQDVAHWLDRQGIAVRAGHHCAMPLMQSLGLPGTLRASFAFYNTFQEAEQLAQALEQLVQSQKSILPVAKLEQTSYQNALKSVYSATNWTSRYQSLMQLGQAAPPLPHALKQDRFLLPGCESRVWLITELDANGLLNCRADADARILRALLTLLLDQVNGLTPEQMLATDLEETLSQLDIQRHLSPSRGNGLLAIIRGLQDFARQQDE